MKEIDQCDPHPSGLIVKCKVPETLQWCHDNYQIVIDLWYIIVAWNDPKIREPIHIKMSPQATRWKLGISR